MKKSLSVSFLCLVLIFTAIPFCVFAETGDDFILDSDFISWLPGEGEINAQYPGEGVITDDTIYDSFEAAGASLRSAMQSRAASVILSWICEPEQVEEMNRAVMREARAIFNEAIAHTGDPYGGVLLRNTTQVKGALTASMPYCRSWYEADGHIVAVGTFNITYVLSSMQDALFKEYSDAAVSMLQFEGKTEYERACAVYGYIINHAQYGNLGTGYWAYGPLVEGKGLCDGTAQLVYHLMLRAGIDCRYLIGYSGGGPETGVPLHAWNIVKVDGKWYNVDATFDLRGNPSSPYYDTTELNGVGWFLKCDRNFETDRYGRSFHGRMENYDYLPDLERAESDWGTYVILADVRLDSELGPGEYEYVYFIPRKTGAYKITASNTDKPLHISVETYIYGAPVYGEPGDDIQGKNIKLTKDEVYIFRVSFADGESCGPFSLRIRDASFNGGMIKDVKCESLYYTETVTASPVVKSVLFARYKKYDVRPKKMAVLLEDGTVIEGSLTDVIKTFKDKYDYDVRYKIEGDDQTQKNPWRAGTHHLILHFEELEAKYDVVITKQAYVKEPVIAKP